LAARKRRVGCARRPRELPARTDADRYRERTADLVRLAEAGSEICKQKPGPMVRARPDLHGHLDPVRPPREEYGRGTASREAPFPAPWSKEFFESELYASARFNTVARAGNRGHRICRRNVVLDELHVEQIAVEAEERGRGSRVTMERCIEFASRAPPSRPFARMLRK